MYDETSIIGWKELSCEAELVTMRFIADVPPMGYRTYYVQSLDSESKIQDISIDDFTINMSNYRIQFTETGTIKSLISNSQSKSILQSNTTFLAGNIAGVWWQNSRNLSIYSDAVSVLACEHGSIGDSHTYDLLYKMISEVLCIILSIRFTPLFKGLDIRDTFGESNRKIEYTIRFSNHIGTIICTREELFLISSYNSKFDLVFTAFY